MKARGSLCGKEGSDHPMLAYSSLRCVPFDGLLMFPGSGLLALLPMDLIQGHNYGPSFSYNVTPTTHSFAKLGLPVTYL